MSVNKKFSLRSLRGSFRRSFSGGGLSVLCGLFFFLGFLFLLSSCKDDHQQIVQIDNYPSIYPDYINVTIPYNIAPLNFRVPEECDRIEVLFSGRIRYHLPSPAKIRSTSRRRNGNCFLKGRRAILFP